MDQPDGEPSQPVLPDETLRARVRRKILGKPRDLTDPHALHVCEQITKKYLRDRLGGFFNRLLHNETPMRIQRRLQWLRLPMVVLPVRAYASRSPPVTS